MDAWLPAPLSQVLFALVVAAVAGALQGGVGFGAALIAAPLLVLVDPVIVPLPLLTSLLALCVLMTWRDRAGMDLGGIGWALAGRVPGTLAGLWALGHMDARALSLAVGVVVLLAVVTSAARVSVRPTPRALLLAGVASSFMGTTTTIGGPPMAILYQHEPGPRFRGTLSGFFAIGATISWLSIVAVHGIGADEVLWAALLTPAVCLGFAASSRLARFLDQGYTRTAILSVSTLAGVLAIVRALAW